MYVCIIPFVYLQYLYIYIYVYRFYMHIYSNLFAVIKQTFPHGTIDTPESRCKGDSFPTSGLDLLWNDPFSTADPWVFLYISGCMNWGCPNQWVYPKTQREIMELLKMMRNPWNWVSPSSNMGCWPRRSKLLRSGRIWSISVTQSRRFPKWLGLWKSSLNQFQIMSFLFFTDAFSWTKSSEDEESSNFPQTSQVFFGW